MNPISDVQSEKAVEFEALQWVGMTQIQMAIAKPNKEQETSTIPVQVDFGVNLKANHRGIHMSRLYQILQNQLLNKPLTAELIDSLLKQSIESQAGLSAHSTIVIQGLWPVQTKALVSEFFGFRSYPFRLIAEKIVSGPTKLWLEVEVLYSSTCPQSARLALEVHQAKNSSSSHPFTAWQATPHAQRSRARVQVLVTELNSDLIEDLIQKIESALGTPVQTTVKKSDEMKFAELNAENLMFCEDAARKIYRKLKEFPEFKGFQIHCRHEESLHPHDATSLINFNYEKPLNL